MADTVAGHQPRDSQVRDYMTPNPETLEVNHSLLDAALLLRRTNLRHIPILQDGQLVGVLTDRDVARFTPTMLLPVSAQEYNRVFEETPVEKVMSRNPLSIASDAPLSEAVELLFRNRLGCLPVLEKNRLIGIITVTDMLRALHDLIAPSPDSPEAA